MAKEIVVIPLAVTKAGKRSIHIPWIEETVHKPEQKVTGYGGRTVYQRRYQIPGRSQQLLRVVCEEKEGKSIVVTAYLTSDIERYWRKQ